MKPRFFATPQDFRAWFEAHHSTVQALLVGFHRKGSGLPSITWPESVDQALCRLRRLATLIDDSANGRRLKGATRRPPA